jgi:autoinducer 2-degrading protein
MPMLVVHVIVHVNAEHVDAFIEATVDNASNSIQESGIARFDLIQQADDPTKFVLVEVYRTPEAPAQHKETAHYLRWRDAVAPMMASPRQSTKYTNLFPTDAEW